MGYSMVVLLAWYRVKFNKLSDSDNKAEIDRYTESNDDEDGYTCFVL